MSLEDKIVDYQANKKDIEHWVALKGEYRYEAIISFLKEKGIEATWKNVTYYIKYDKRILINSFKYIVFLEEMYKSFIFKFTSNKRIKSMNFQQAYHEYLSLGEKADFDDIDLDTMQNSKKIINAFRNRVVHNNILLNNKYNGVSLEETLCLFVKILPQSYRAGFIKDINGCSRDLTDDMWHIKIKE